MVKEVILKCVALDDRKTEYELKGLDEQSTLYALGCLLNEVVPFIGPFNLKYASNMEGLKGKKHTSLKRAGIKTGAVIVFEPVSSEAGQRKEGNLPTMEPLLRQQSSRRNSTPFEYDFQGYTLKEVTGDQEITLDGWDDDKEDEEDGLGDMPPVTALPPLQRQVSWVVVGNLQINEKQKEMIEECSKVLLIPEDDSAKLLRTYDWEIETVLAKYTDDPDLTFKEAGIEREKEEINDEPKTSDKPEETEEKGDLFDCPLCGDEVPWEESQGLACGHLYCDTCWKGWLEAKFENGPECIFTKCMDFECQLVVPATFYQKNVDKEKAAKIEQYTANAFVTRSADIKWCPAKNCGRAIEYKKKAQKTVTCSCGHMFCFGCGADCHDPCPCKVVAKWNSKNKDESSIFEWIEKNKAEKDVKNCTKCHIIIEKNQGCKHMTCRNCKHEFCWLCYQNWNGHNETICTNYQKTKDKVINREKKENEGDETGDDFRKYQFYYTRFDNHAQAIQYAEKIKEETEERMVKLQDITGEGRHRVQFLLDAVTEIIKCRSLLQWSYPWCFFLKEDSNLYRLFKGHQEVLEKFTEELHGLTEQPIETQMKGFTRRDIIDRTRVLESYRGNIIEFAKDNY